MTKLASLLIGALIGVTIADAFLLDFLPEYVDVLLLIAGIVISILFLR